MRYAVLIKQVPDTRTVRMDEKTGTVVRDGSQAVINPLDLYALKAALSLKTEDAAANVTVISMGPAAAEKALREALALGADDALLICDRVAAGSDTMATSKILAAALRKFGPFDAIFTGERATDGDTGQVGPEIASALGVGLATYVGSVKTGQGGLEAERKTENDVEQWLVHLPAVISVTKAIGEVGLPTLAGKKAARRRPIPTVTVAELGLAAEEVGLNGSPTRVVKIFHPSIGRKGRRITVVDETTLQQATDAIAAMVKGGAQ